MSIWTFCSIPLVFALLKSFSCVSRCASCSSALCYVSFWSLFCIGHLSPVFTFLVSLVFLLFVSLLSLASGTASAAFYFVDNYILLERLENWESWLYLWRHGFSPGLDLTWQIATINGNEEFSDLNFGQLWSSTIFFHRSLWTYKALTVGVRRTLQPFMNVGLLSVLRRMKNQIAPNLPSLPINIQDSDKLSQVSSSPV